MTLGTLVETHGYWLLALGCLLEGETLLLVAGFAAHRGYLDPFAVFAIAAAAGFAGDQFYFWLGRRHGPAVLTRWPAVSRQSERVRRLLDRYDAAIIIGIRFAYGLRTAGPILLGTTAMPAARFALFNAFGALLWSAVVGSLGWVFGQAAELALGEVRRFEGWLLLALLVAAAAAWWFRRRRRR